MEKLFVFRMVLHLGRLMGLQRHGDIGSYIMIRNAITTIAMISFALSIIAWLSVIITLAIDSASALFARLLLIAFVLSLTAIYFMAKEDAISEKENTEGEQ